MMTIKWPKLFSRTCVWLCAEISLTLLGLDDLADYSEFLLQNQNYLQVTQLINHVVSTAL